MTDALEQLLEGKAEHRYQQWRDGIRHYPEPIPGLAMVPAANTALPMMREATGHTMTEAKPRIRPRKLSKLAKATPAVVRSDAEHTEHCRASVAIIKNLLAERARLDSATNDERSNATRARLAFERLSLQCKLVEVCMPLYGITFDDDDSRTVYHCSANVLSDYYREGIKTTLVAFPVMRKYGRIAAIRQSEADVAYCEDYRLARSNEHDMGMAQTAYRIARQENDTDAQWVAHSWLFHGFLAKQCRDPECHKHRDPETGEYTSPCKHVGAMATTANRLIVLALQYLPPQERSGFNGSRLPHRMPKPVSEDTVSKYVAETFDDMRKRLGLR